MAIWGTLIILAASVALSMLLRPKIPKTRGKEFEIPRTEEGAIVPVIHGVGEVAPNIVWVGDIKQVEGSGDDEGQTTYFARMIGILSMGPITELISIRFDDIDIRAYPKDKETDYVLSKPLPHVFGGNHLELFVDAQRLYGGARIGEGGPVGLLHVHPGYDLDVVCELNKFAMGETYASRFPRRCYVSLGWRPGDTGASGVVALHYAHHHEDVRIPPPNGVEWGWIPFNIPVYPDVTVPARWVLDGNPWGLSLGEANGSYYDSYLITGLIPGEQYSIRGSVAITAAGGGSHHSTTFLGIKVSDFALNALDNIPSPGVFTAYDLSSSGGFQFYEIIFTAPVSGTKFVHVGCFNVEYGQRAHQTEIFAVIYPSYGAEGFDGPYRVDDLYGTGFRFGANNPVPKPMTFIMQRTPSGAIMNQSIDRMANPVDVIYEIATDKINQCSIDPILIDEANWEAVGNILEEEKLGICLTQGEQNEGDDWIADILDTIDAVPYEDPITGLLCIALIRDDYDPELLPVFDISNTRDVEIEYMDGAELISEVQVQFRRLEGVEFGQVEDFIISAKPKANYFKRYWLGATYIQTGEFIRQGATTFVDGVDYAINRERGYVYFLPSGALIENTTPVLIDYTARPTFCGFRDGIQVAQNLALIEATGGRVRSETINLPMLATDEQAQLAAFRRLMAVSRNLPKVKFIATRDAYDLHPGSVIKLSRSDLGIDDLVIRITSIPSRGKLDDNEMAIEGVEDKFSLQTSSNISLPDPDGEAGPTDPGNTFQLPRPAGLYAVDPSAIRWGIFAADPYYNLELETADDEDFTVNVINTVVAGTVTYVDEVVTIGLSRYARLRHVDQNEIALPSEWIEYGPFTAVVGSVGTPEVELPQVIVNSSDTGTGTGIVTLALIDPQSRVIRVEFSTKSAIEPATSWIEDPSPYSATVTIVSGYQSYIAWRVVYIDGDGDESYFSDTIFFGAVSGSGTSDVDLTKIITVDGAIPDIVLTETGEIVTME